MWSKLFQVSRCLLIMYMLRDNCSRQLLPDILLWWWLLIAWRQISFFLICDNVLICHFSYCSESISECTGKTVLLVLKSSVCSCIICKVNTLCCLFVSWENNLQWKRCIQKVTVQTQANVLPLFEWYWILQSIKRQIQDWCTALHSFIKVLPSPPLCLHFDLRCQKKA